MGYGIAELVKVIEVLRSKGIDGVIIGSTVLALAVGVKEFEDDIDLFVTSMSPTIEDQRIRSIAQELGWDTGTTHIDTPSIIARINDKEILVELYENIFDFYVPSHIVENSRALSIRGGTIKVIRLEDYILLKARRGIEADMEDLRVIESLIRDKKVRIDEGYLRRSLQQFPEEDIHLITSRLKSIGLKI